jgi:pimeloyl-ACP methyl ester carboxylesterase
MELVMLYMQDLRGNVALEERTALYNDVLRKCRDRLRSQGASLAAYTTVASAADVKDVVEALGYKEVTLYGASYGTRLALVVMRDHPEIVRSAVLDSVLPIEVNYYETAAVKSDSALQLLFEACAADPSCREAYPDLEEVFYELVDELNQRPVLVEIINPLDKQVYPVPLDGIALVGAVRWGLRSSYAIPMIPQAIYRIRDGDYWLFNYAMTRIAASYTDYSLGLIISIDCHEEILVRTPEEIASDFVAFPSIESYVVDSIYDSGEALIAICEMWGAAPLDPQENRALVSDIPTLIIAGELDPTTPPPFGQQVAANLHNSFYFEFPGEGHVPSMGDVGNCPQRVVLDFLRNPGSEPDRSCLAEMTGPAFVLPAPPEAISMAPFTDTTYGITGLAPQGWSNYGYGYYQRRNSPLDVTTLVIQAAPYGQEELLQLLSGSFGQTGFDVTPEETGTYEADGQTWTLYESWYYGMYPVEVAMTEFDGLTALIVLVCDPGERDALHESVFLPAIDALVPAGEP